jgi:hypothetical protein
MVEFAMLLPIFMTVLALTAEIGRSFLVTTQTTNANREGALWAGHHFADCTGTCGAVPVSATFQSPCSPAVNNDTEPNFEKNVKCAIASEATSSTAVFSCPAGNQVTFTWTTTSGVPISPPPAPNTHGLPANVTIEVDCLLAPLVGLPPLPTAYTVASKATAYVFN